MSCGNDGPWKAWKAKSRLPTLSTVLGKPAKAAGFPHSHSSDDWSLYKENEARPALRPGRKPSTRRVGQNKLPKWAEISCQTHLLLFSLRCLAEVCEGDPMRLIFCLLCLGGGAAVAQHRSPVAPVEPDARLWRPWLLTSASEIRPGASPQRAESARELLAVRTARGRLRC